ncbi:Abi family protein [Kaistella jeonii]|uniref:Abi family protein n=1 Tax=Kaistella jeonii TaxID=266749 RepID=A0A0C1CVX5_9FLAO|nr:Abi family protein [Kaistella jeonii]KIA88496.1 hypothetical protein OA86_10720 [Kaistella jeonii]SFC19325.1 Abortive infection bacteriophage resistance protein [Kaistella jeonii]VEI97036.1 Abortive infection bacteriophage resistance protein [Kaistella jeonii]
MKYAKEPYANIEHIKLLRERGLIIDDEHRAEKYLDSIGYYRLTGYMFHLQDKNDNNKFVTNSNYDEIINLYKFDKALRGIISEYIERIEVCVRAKLSNKYSIKYGFYWYLDQNLFADHRSHEIIINEIFNAFSDPKERFLISFKRKYSGEKYPPSNMALEILSFGKLARLYSALKNEEIKNEIANEFKQVSSILSGYLIYINNVRNICASRLWNKKVTADRPAIPSRKKYNFKGNIPDDFNTTVYGIVSIIHRLLEPFNPSNKFTQRIAKLIKEYKVNPELMGFPSDWENEATWLK